MSLKSIIKTIKSLEIKTRKVVNSTFAGNYHSLFKGQGISFSDLRGYQYGDELRLIDWKVTAKTQAPYVKLFEEERELTVMLMVDLSASGDFGSAGKTKREVMCEIAAVLGFSAAKNKDKVGLVLFTNQVELYIPPKKGKKHIFRILRDIFYFKARFKKTDLGVPVDFLLRALKQRAIVFMLSDFIAEGYEKPMKMMAKKHDFTPILVFDQRESDLSDSGMVFLEDQETGEPLCIDSGSAEIREAVSTISYSQLMEKRRFFKQYDMDYVSLGCCDDYVTVLASFFKSKVRKRR